MNNIKNVKENIKKNTGNSHSADDNRIGKNTSAVYRKVRRRKIVFNKTGIEKITKNINCYGCGAEVSGISGPKHEYIGSDAGCWAVFCDVLAKEYMNYNELWQSHRLTVDTYAAQHPGEPSRRSVQSVFIHLSRLYLQLEGKLEGSKANEFMKNVTIYKNEFKWLGVPDFSGTVNVLDAAKAKDMEEHKLLVEKWARSVWEAWSEHHNVIIPFAEKVLNNSRVNVKHSQ